MLQHLNLEQDFENILEDIGVQVSIPDLDITTKGLIIHDAEVAPSYGYTKSLSQKFHELTLSKKSLNPTKIKRGMSIIIDDTTYSIYAPPKNNTSRTYQIYIQ